MCFYLYLRAFYFKESNIIFQDQIYDLQGLELKKRDLEHKNRRFPRFGTETCTWRNQNSLPQVSEGRTAHACKAHGRARLSPPININSSSSSHSNHTKTSLIQLLSLNLHFSSTLNLTYLHQNSTNSHKTFTQTNPKSIPKTNTQTKSISIHPIH